MIKISIIVPVYNVSEYLERCIGSLLGQTLDGIEIILVNDGSTDNSPAICEGYARKYDNVRYISQVNQGLSGARNSGLKIARGEYVGFVDSDDYVKKDMFELLYRNAVNNRADVSACGYESVYVDGKAEGHEKKNIRKNYGKDEALDYYLLHGYFEVVAWNKIFRRELFHGISFPVGKIYEDIPTICKLIDLAGGIFYDSTPKYLYFCRDGSLSHSDSRATIKDLKEHIDVAVTFCRRKIQKPKYLYFGQAEWYLMMFHKMLNSDVEDKEIVKKIRNLVRAHFLQICFTSKIPLDKKVKFCIISLSPSFYKKIYFIHSKNRRI